MHGIESAARDSALGMQITPAVGWRDASRRATRLGGFVQLVKATASGFSKDQCGLRAAALCYYTVFALPPLLILLIAIAGFIWSPAVIQHAVEAQFGALMGPGGARTVSDMVSSGHQGNRGMVGTVLGATGLIIGATGAFLALQAALNVVWELDG